MIKHITAAMKMADVVHSNYHLLPVLTRFDIKPGFADKTIQKLCDENNINIDFFLEIINTFNDENYFPQKKLKSFNIEWIVEYLRKTHKYYLDYQIKIIGSLLENLTIDKERTGNLLIINNFFNDYKEELRIHMESEEKTTFPFSIEVASLFRENNRNGFKELLKKYPEDHFEQEHVDMEAKLYDLKNLLIKYLPQPFDCNLFNTAIFEITRLEKDMTDHTRIEDKILKPAIEEMAAALKN